MTRPSRRFGFPNPSAARASRRHLRGEVRDPPTAQRPMGHLKTRGAIAKDPLTLRFVSQYHDRAPVMVWMWRGCSRLRAGPHRRESAPTRAPCCCNHHRSSGEGNDGGVGVGLPQAIFSQDKTTHNPLRKQQVRLVAKPDHPSRITKPPWIPKRTSSCMHACMHASCVRACARRRRRRRRRRAPGRLAPSDPSPQAAAAAD
jgi:hypothetical protein